MNKFMFLLSLIILSFGMARAENDWDSPSRWIKNTDGESYLEIITAEGKIDKGLAVEYRLKTGGGWVEFINNVEKKPEENFRISFYIKTEGTGNFEIKFIDQDGSVFGTKISLDNAYRNWTEVVVGLENLDYWWGGENDEFDGLKTFNLAVSGNGSGILYLDKIGFSKPGRDTTLPKAGPMIDKYAEKEGVGFKERRSKKIIKEDPLILEYLKQVQDSFSDDKMLLPSMEGNQAQTFNNALVAMAFILKGEKERAERILDFYSTATVEEMWCPDLQNFFYRGRARGFFQYVNLNRKGGTPAYCNPGIADRWMGDMSWLLIAYKYYEKEYGKKRYQKITKLLKDLLISWYKDDKKGGYIQHGWRSGDKYLHEKSGHPEGNIDAYAAMKLCGEEKIAENIRKWLDSNVHGKNLPLDLYTWRVLAYGKEAAELLNIPDYDLRYRKTLKIRGNKAAGIYPFPDRDVKNIWLDGTGHIACAYFAAGDARRGAFYANQLDAFIIEREIGNKMTHAIPYTANNTGAYSWVETDKGFVSVAAWYIFAKNMFNPLTLEKQKLDISIKANPYPVHRTRKEQLQKTVKPEVSDYFSNMSNWDMISENKTPFEAEYKGNNSVEIGYSLEQGNWGIMSTQKGIPERNSTVKFELKSNGSSNNLEVKWQDKDGSVFGFKIENVSYKKYKTITIKPSDFKYWWGGDTKLGSISKFEFAVSRSEGGSGKFYIKNLEFK